MDMKSSFGNHKYHCNCYKVSQKLCSVYPLPSVLRSVIIMTATEMPWYQPYPHVMGTSMATYIQAKAFQFILRFRQYASLQTEIIPITSFYYVIFLTFENRETRFPQVITPPHVAPQSPNSIQSKNVTG